MITENPLITKCKTQRSHRHPEAMPSKCALKHSLASFTEAAAGLPVIGERTLCCYAEKSGEGSQNQDRDGQERRGISTQELDCQRSCHRSCYIDLLVPWKKGMGEDVAFSLRSWWPSQGAKIS